MWRLISVVILAAGPVVAAFGYFDGGTESPQLDVGGRCHCSWCRSGSGAWRATTRAQRRLLRLEAVGLPATGEVLTPRELRRRT